MKLVRWDPFHELVAMSNRFNRQVNDSYLPRTEDAFGAWAPPVDILERQDHLVIRAEVPGVQKDDMDVRIEDGVLTLHGERKEEKEAKDVNTHLVERVYGSFTRSFSLPTTVDPTKVSAVYKDGVLEVTVPKVETAKPKRGEIKVAYPPAAGSPRDRGTRHVLAAVHRRQGGWPSAFPVMGTKRTGITDSRR